MAFFTVTVTAPAAVYAEIRVEAENEADALCIADKLADGRTEWTIDHITGKPIVECVDEDLSSFSGERR